ncbi:MAG: alpha/beta hydrolase domain-containing protein [Actinomycetota bacterium]
MQRCRCVGVLLAVVVLAAACSGDDDDPVDAAPAAESTAIATSTPEPAPTPQPTARPPATAEPTATPEPARFVAARVPDVAALAADGLTLPIPNVPVPDSWAVEEYAFGGSAVGFDPVGEITADGSWEVTEGASEDYRSRLIVRRPPAGDFSGVVLVEWMNVTSGADIATDWGFVSEEIIRSGHAWVGVSAQSVSVNGTEGDFVGGGLIDTRGLKVIEPERYGDLGHPGDRFAYDIFTQAGAAVAGLAATPVLGGLEPTHLVAIGESQSAAFLTGYLNTAHPSAGLYDGFLVHSRGGGAPGPTGERLDFVEDAVRIRSDLTDPVFVFEAETDVVLLGFVDARQDDTDLLRTWEVAGAAHVDTHTLAATAGFPRDPSLGSVIGCENLINDGPHHETLQAAMSHLVAWVVDGTPPPSAPPLDVVDGQLVRDDLGIATGGVRTPPVDVPLRVLSGDPGSDGGACFLFGETRLLDEATVAARYGSLDAFVGALNASADAAVAAGWLLPIDAEVMIEEETTRAVSLGLS